MLHYNVKAHPHGASQALSSGSCDDYNSHVASSISSVSGLRSILKEVVQEEHISLAALWKEESKQLLELYRAEMLALLGSLFEDKLTVGASAGSSVAIDQADYVIQSAIGGARRKGAQVALPTNSPTSDTIGFKPTSSTPRDAAQAVEVGIKPPRVSLATSATDRTCPSSTPDSRQIESTQDSDERQSRPSGNQERRSVRPSQRSAFVFVDFNNLGSSGKPRAADEIVMQVVQEKVEAMKDTRKNASHRLGLLYSPIHEPSPGAPLIKRIVHSSHFEFLCACVIFGYLVLLCFDVQYTGMENGHSLGVGGFQKSADDKWPFFDDVYEVLDYSLNLFFICELCLRIASDHLSAYRSGWIWFDTILVTFSVVEMLEVSDINASMLRVCRVMRCLRVLRVLRNMSALESLFLIMRSIEESVGALFWSFIVLGTFTLSFGLLLHQLLAPVIDDGNRDKKLREELFDYFGTFPSTLLTMFEITLANWVPPTRVLHAVSAWYSMVIIIYRCMFCFAAVKIITAVFIAQTNLAIQRDDQISFMAQEQEMKLFRNKLYDVFLDLDLDKNGYLTWDEFNALTNHDIWQGWGRKLGIPMSDLESLFILLSDSDGHVSADDFFHGIERVKGYATGVDIVWLRSVVNKLDVKLSHFLRKDENSRHRLAASVVRHSDLLHVNEMQPKATISSV